MSRPADPSADVAIIGGGIVGTATALFLARAGVRVTLYEATEIAAAASGRNSGVIQRPFDPVMDALYRGSLDEYRSLDEATGGALALGNEPAGLLQVGHDLATAQAEADAWRAMDSSTSAEVLAGAELQRLEPTLAGDLVACRLAIGYPVAPAAATLAFAAEAERAGARLVVGHAARPVERGGVAVGIEVDGDVVAAGAVVIAAGPWSPALVDPRAAWQPIRPVWGVVARVELPDPPRHVLEEASLDIEPDDDPDAAHEVVDAEEVGFSLVTAAGVTSLGSTFLEAEPRAREFVDAIRAGGSRFVPGLATAPVVSVRSCARPVSADGRPLVGPIPWVDRLFIAAGHGPWGISTGPATARLIADVVLGRDVSVPPALSAARFGRHI